MKRPEKNSTHTLEEVYTLIDQTLNSILDGMDIDDPKEIYNAALLTAYDQIEETTLGTNIQEWLSDIVRTTISERECEEHFIIDTETASPEAFLLLSGLRKTFEAALDRALIPSPAVDLYGKSRLNQYVLEQALKNHLERLGYKGLPSQIEKELCTEMDILPFITGDKSLDGLQLKRSSLPQNIVLRYISYRQESHRESLRLRRKLDKVGYTGSINALRNTERGIEDLEKCLKDGNPINTHSLRLVRSLMEWEDDHTNNDQF